MKVVILAGGFGTRIRDVAEDIPKPMIPIGQNPILWHIMKYYASFDHKDFVLCLGYKGNVIRNFFLNYSAFTRDFTLTLGAKEQIDFHSNNTEADWRVTFAETGLNAMTGARVRKIKKYIGDDETFMLTYGDGVADIDLDALLAFHKAHGKILTVSGVRPPGRFGELGCDDTGRVREFNEKPQASGGRISGGYFVADRRIFDWLEDREDLVFEQEPMRALVAEGEMMVYRHNGFWQPMDTAREFSGLNALYATGHAPWVR